MKYSYPIIKLPNDVYYFGDFHNRGMDVYGLAFALYGIRTPKNTLVIEASMIEIMGTQSISIYLKEKKLSHFDKIFFVINHNISRRGYNTNNLKRDIARYFKGITSKISVYDIAQWFEKSNLSDLQINWLNKILSQMMNDNRFILGQLSDRMTLERAKNNLIDAKAKVEKQEKELSEMKTIEEIQSSNVQNILKMKWIDKIEPASNCSIRILTKPLACTYVPNIGKYVSSRSIMESDILYRMMKYQCLGKYFIVLPSYYVVASNFDIKGDDNNRYPITPARKVMINNTYFHDMACHIGNGHSCLGELTGAISAAVKTGLDMLLMSFEVYLRSINLPDAAGQRYYCLPMGDAQGNIEVWPYVEDFMKQRGITFKDKERNLDTYNEILSMDKMTDINGKPFEGECRSWEEREQDANMQRCLEIIKSREPDVYEQIMKRVEEGAVL